MPLVLVQFLVRTLYIYAGVGVLLLPWWHARGLARFDRTTRGATWGFRALISPALVALWPLLLRRALKDAGHPPEERNAHRRAAGKGAA